MLNSDELKGMCRITMDEGTPELAQAKKALLVLSPPPSPRYVITPLSFRSSSK